MQIKFLLLSPKSIDTEMQLKGIILNPEFKIASFEITHYF